MNFLLVLKYHTEIMAIVRWLEQVVPDDVPGVKKLDMALKAVIAVDDKLANAVPELTKAFSLAKGVYNAAKSSLGTLNAGG